MRFLCFCALLATLSSCIPLGPKRVRLNAANEAQQIKPALADPSFVDERAFIQNGEKLFYQTFTLPGDARETFKLRGKNIHQFLKTPSNRLQELCLLARFSDSFEHKLLLLALTTRKEVDLKERTLEYYYLVQSVDSSVNSAHCRQQGLTDELSEQFSGESIGYLIERICPSCSLGMISDELQIFDADSGANQSRMLAMSPIRLQLLFRSPLGPGTTPACVDDNQCKAINDRYDCCLEQQCVVDQTIKRGVDTTSAAFLRSAEHISLDPTHIFRYSEFYYICPKDLGHRPKPQSEEKPKDQLLILQQLYNCSNVGENEEGFCTLTYPEASEAIKEGAPFDARADDRDFSGIWSGPPDSLDAYTARGAIVEITYAGKVLYDERHLQCMRSGSECFDGHSCTDVADRCPIVKNPEEGPGERCQFDPVGSNDNLTDSQCVVIKPGFADSKDAPHDRLEITYRVDSSCQRINSLLAKCTKYYVQGQFKVDKMKVDDHSPQSQVFKLPSYANTSQLIQVFADGYRSFEGEQWDRSGLQIEFDSTFPVFQGQRIRIEYYADLSLWPGLLISKDRAVQQINEICDYHGSYDWSLQPVYSRDPDDAETIINYNCMQPEIPVVDPPLEQGDVLDSQAVPVRFYDENGRLHDEINARTPAQENQAFQYVDGSPLTPNNLDSSVGFNEIYGTISIRRSGAKPPLRISVKAGYIYDIFVYKGQFSSCAKCGRDYYSALSRLFPRVFDDPGGGYDPDPFRTSRTRHTTGYTRFRSDDLLFGRACFVPATMIPWSHRPNTDINQQRQSRQAAQHFLFANGYQRDWYGFDYGSVIGSFDGSHWFSIGGKRQIRATSNKLYLAVNAYFGDLTAGAGYTVRVHEVTGNVPHLDIAKTDEDSTGAQCRKYHQCRSDQDCVAQLGWDYACEDIRSLRTPWPLFDQNGKELRDSATMLSLAYLAHRGGAVRSGKRCVYRGRGAPCHGNYGSIKSSDSYANMNTARINGCSMNHWCADLASKQVFNEKIARFAASPLKLPEGYESHLFGLGARMIGRPFDYNGSVKPSDGLIAHLGGNNVAGLCLPGRNPNVGNVTFETQHVQQPSASDGGDMVGHVGMTRRLLLSSDYLNSCPVLDEDGEFYHFEHPTASLEEPELGVLSTKQNLGTNALAQQYFNSDPDIAELLSSFVDVVEKPVLQEARCVRGAGSACFTDWDCAPSSQVSRIFNNFDAEIDHTELGVNGYEIRYWQEELVCGQKAEPLSLNYDLKKSICCRKQGKKLTIGSQDDSSLFGVANTSEVPGVGIGLDQFQRNTRSHVAFQEMQDEPDEFPALKVAADDNCSGGSCSGTSAHPLKQFNTFAAIAERTCCTGHWVREFHEENGGGHHWLPRKMQQTFEKDNLLCLNYDLTDSMALSAQECIDTTAKCDCTSPDNPTCAIRSIPQAEAKNYNYFFSSLELLGIPQVLIKSDADQFQADGDPVTCVAPFGTAAAGDPMPGTLDSSKSPANDAEFEESGNDRFYYKASDAENFDDDLKQVFSPDEITCCVPPGSIVSRQTPERACCSGKIAALDDDQVCCLEDYTNLTVFFNRYVSSMLKDIPSGRFDPLTGRPLYIEVVRRVALRQGVCCSGKVGTGRAYSSLRVPTATNFTTRVMRFIQGGGNEDNSEGQSTHFDFGLRWNTDVYCVP